MIARFEWSPDRLPAGLDPYSRWMLITGRDFDLVSREPVEDPDRDFTHVAVVQRDDLESRVKGGKPIFSIEPVPDLRSAADSRQLVTALTGLGQGTENALILPLPLRARSISRNLSFASSAWSPLGNLRENSNPPENGGSPGNSDRPEDVDLTQPIVVVACIDDAFNIFHQRFRTGPATSRVDYAWVQDCEAPEESAVPFGREWTNAEIVAELEGRGEDEESLLRRLGLVDFSRPGLNPLARRATHGNHVLDVAAGADAGVAGLANQRIIVVALPTLVTRETSGALLTQFFAVALQYVFLRTREIHEGVNASIRRTGAVPPAGSPVRLVVNFSYGIAGGPHDGSDYIERLVELMAKDHDDREFGPVAVCVPAGNGNLARGHASLVWEFPDSVGQGAREEATLRPAAPPSAGDVGRSSDGSGSRRHSFGVCWQVQPGDRSSSYLEFWLPPEAGNVMVRVTPPGGAGRPPGAGGRPGRAGEESDNAEYRRLLASEPQVLHAGRRAGDTIDERTIIGRLSLDQPSGTVPRVGSEAAPPRKRQRVLLALAPTDTGETGRLSAPAGPWDVEISAELPAGVTATVDAWIQRDDSPLGFSGPGRQSYFVDPAYRRFTGTGDLETRDRNGAQVRRGGTLNGIATGPSTIVIAGYAADGDRRRVAPYSATPGRDGKRLDASAASDRSRAVRGVLAAGARSGSRVAISGTSVAVPQAVRLIAEAWRENREVRSGEAAALIRRMAETAETGRADTPDPDRTGAGRLPVPGTLAGSVRR